MRRKLLILSIGGALGFGLLAASAQAAPGQLGAVGKSDPTHNNLFALAHGHGGGGHGFGGVGGHGFGGHGFGGVGGHGFGGHVHGFHHGLHHFHGHGFGIYWGGPYYGSSDCRWSHRYHQWVCPYY